jgi:hypothetical protein
MSALNKQAIVPDVTEQQKLAAEEGGAEWFGTFEGQSATRHFKGYVILHINVI